MNNYINIVQEYYQKHRLNPATPQYQFISDGPDHMPSWQCTITLFDNTKFTGKNDMVKSKAKLNAAEMAYNYIFNDIDNSSSIINSNIDANNGNNSSNNVIEYHIDYNTISRLIVIDLENYPQGIKLQSNSELGVLGFLSHSHALYEKLPLDGIQCQVIRSTRKDSADQYMVFTVSKLLHKYHEIWITNNLQISILSKDNFAGVLCDIIRQEYSDIKVEHITSLRDI